MYVLIDTLEAIAVFFFTFAFHGPCWYSLRHYFPDDIKDDLCTASNDSRDFWGLWGRDV